MRTEGEAYIQRPPSEYFGLLYFDSLARSAPALNFLVESMGAERVMFGSAYPADMNDPDPVKTIASLPHITGTGKEMIHSGNAMRLFKIEG